MKTKTANGRSPPTTEHHSDTKHPNGTNQKTISNNNLKLEIMKTTVIESGKGTNKVNSSAVNVKAENKEQPKTNGLPLSKEFDDKPKGDTTKTETPAKPAEQPKPQETSKTETLQPHAEQAKPEAPKAEPSKMELKEQLAQKKPALNLDETLKLIADLARKTALRDRYKANIDGLQEFGELAKEDIDELEDESAFQQCELIISHAKGYKFSIKSPSVIKGTVDFIASRLSERMAEVEASIVLPA